MSRRRDALLARRAELVARSAAQRADIARGLDAWRGAFAGVGRTFAWVGPLRRNPLLSTALGVVAVAFVASRRVAASELLSRVRVGWRLGRTVLRSVTGLIG